MNQVIKCPACDGTGWEDKTPKLLVKSESLENGICRLCAGMMAVAVRPATKEEAQIAMSVAFILDTDFGGQ